MFDDSGEPTRLHRHQRTKYLGVIVWIYMAIRLLPFLKPGNSAEGVYSVDCGTYTRLPLGEKERSLLFDYSCLFRPHVGSTIWQASNPHFSFPPPGPEDNSAGSTSWSSFLYYTECTVSLVLQSRCHCWFSKDVAIHLFAKQAYDPEGNATPVEGTRASYLDNGLIEEAG